MLLCGLRMPGTCVHVSLKLSPISGASPPSPEVGDLSISREIHTGQSRSSLEVHGPLNSPVEEFHTRAARTKSA